MHSHYTDQSVFISITGTAYQRTMKVLLLLLLASASTVFGKSLAASNLLLADEVTANFDIDQSNSGFGFSGTTNDRFTWPPHDREEDQDAVGESSGADFALSRETEEEEPSNNDNEKPVSFFDCFDIFCDDPNISG